MLFCVSMINAMKVGEHMKKTAKKLSGGTKRKVSWFAGSVSILAQLQCDLS